MIEILGLIYLVIGLALAAAFYAVVVGDLAVPTDTKEGQEAKGSLDRLRQVMGLSSEHRVKALVVVTLVIFTLIVAWPAWIAFAVIKSLRR